MILTVSGWRDWTDTRFVLQRLRSYHNHYGADLFWRVGCARGVDKLVREFLTDMRIPDTNFCIYRANWNGLGRRAGNVRNGQMLEGDNSRDPCPGVKADRLLAFPQPGLTLDAKGSGTINCIKEAFRLAISLDVPGYYDSNSI